MSTPELIGNRASRAMALKQQIRNAERPTTLFKLVHTQGIEVEVQRPSLPYLMASGHVPDAFRKIVDLHIRKFGRPGVAQGNFSLDEAAANELLAEHGMDLLTFQTDMYDATVLVGFVVPPVTKDRELAEREDSPYIWIEDIDPRDRAAFYNWCNAETEAEVEAVKSDTGTAPVSDNVADVPYGDGLRVPAVRHDSSAFMGQRRDEI